MSISRSGIPYLTHVWNAVVGCWVPIPPIIAINALQSCIRGGP